MDYLSNYYKNLCEQLQEKINILEAGLQQAMKTGEPELMKKEFLKGKARKERKLSAAREEENKAEEINDTNVPKGAEEKLANPDDKEDFNDQKEQTKRAKERAKEISVKSAGPKETSTMGVDGKGKGQKHHEVTGKKKTEESIFSNDERNALLDWYFG